MPEVIAGLEIPETAAVAETTRLIQRFELDGADHARRFLLDRGFSTAAAETVSAAIALHTTPGIPGRMAPEIATTQLGVLTDAIGFGLDGLERDQLGEILDVRPREDCKNEFLRARVEGLKDRPETTNGTVNSDVLEHFVPGFKRMMMVERVLGSPGRADRASQEVTR